MFLDLGFFLCVWISGLTVIFASFFLFFFDQVMAIIADFMLVYLPAPTVSLRPPLALTAGGISKFFHNCPDNAFQVSFKKYCLAHTG